MVSDIDIYLNIIREGILNIRLISKKEDVNNIYTEINHIHNIPDIMHYYDMLNRYKTYLYNKNLYENNACDSLKQSFKHYWDELDSIVSCVPMDEKSATICPLIVINMEGLILDGIKRLSQSMDTYSFEVLKFKVKPKFNSEMYIQHYGYDIVKIIKKQLFLNILKQGIINIRLCCINKDFEQIYFESNHIHNITNLIKNFDDEKVAYYKKIEKRQFIKESKHEYVGYYKYLWDEL